MHPTNERPPGTHLNGVKMPLAVSTATHTDWGRELAEITGQTPPADTWPDAATCLAALGLTKASKAGRQIDAIANADMALHRHLIWTSDGNATRVVRLPDGTVHGIAAPIISNRPLTTTDTLCIYPRADQALQARNGGAYVDDHGWTATWWQTCPATVLIVLGGSRRAAIRKWHTEVTRAGKTVLFADHDPGDATPTPPWELGGVTAISEPDAPYQLSLDRDHCVGYRTISAGDHEREERIANWVIDDAASQTVIDHHGKPVEQSIMLTLASAEKGSGRRVQATCEIDPADLPNPEKWRSNLPATWSVHMFNGDRYVLAQYVADQLVALGAQHTIRTRATGWALTPDGHHAYVAGDMAIGPAGPDDTLRLSDDDRGAATWGVETANTDTAISDAVAVLQQISPRIASAMLAALAHAIIPHDRTALNVTIDGPSTGGKTTTSWMFGSWLSDFPFGSAPFSADVSPPAAAAISHGIRETIIVFDDLAPTGDEHEDAKNVKNISKIKRAVVNGQWPARATRDGGLRASAAPSFVAVLTTEGIPAGVSVANRDLVMRVSRFTPGLEVAPKTTDLEAVIEEIAGGVFRRAAATMLEKIAGDWDTIRSQWFDTRSALTDAVCKRVGITPGRQAGFLAESAAGICILLDLFPELDNAVAPAVQTTADGTTKVTLGSNLLDWFLDTFSEHAIESSSDSRTVTAETIERIRDALESGVVHVTTQHGKCPVQETLPAELDADAVLPRLGWKHRSYGWEESGIKIGTIVNADCTDISKARISLIPDALKRIAGVTSISVEDFRRNALDQYRRWDMNPGDFDGRESKAGGRGSRRRFPTLPLSLIVNTAEAGHENTAAAVIDGNGEPF